MQLNWLHHDHHESHTPPLPPEQDIQGVSKAAMDGVSQSERRFQSRKPVDDSRIVQDPWRNGWGWNDNDDDYEFRREPTEDDIP